MATGGKKPRGKRTHTVRNVIVLVLVLMALFAASFTVFFRLLGGSFSGEDAAVESPTPTAVALRPTAIPKPTAVPNPRKTSAPERDDAAEPTRRTRKEESAADESDGDAHSEDTATAEPTPEPTRPPRTEDEEPYDVDTGEGVPVYGDGYLYPSDTVVISDTELSVMSRNRIRLMYYEIYARHGLTFDDEDLAEYFESRSWYTPTVSDKTDVEHELTEIEYQNLENIESYQRSMGWRK